MVNGLIQGSLDSPMEGSVLPRGPVLIEGWATVHGVPATSVEIRANDSVVGKASVGTPRPDVATGYGDPALENCGFTLLVDLEEIPEGSVLLSASTSDSVVIGRSMVRLVGESGSGRQFNESELRRIAEGQWYYSIELLPGVVAVRIFTLVSQCCRASLCEGVTYLAWIVWIWVPWKASSLYL